MWGNSYIPCLLLIITLHFIHLWWSIKKSQSIMTVVVVALEYALWCNLILIFDIVLLGFVVHKNIWHIVWMWSFHVVFDNVIVLTFYEYILGPQCSYWWIYKAIPRLFGVFNKCVCNHNVCQCRKLLLPNLNSIKFLKIFSKFIPCLLQHSKCSITVVKLVFSCKRDNTKIQDIVFSS